MKKDAIVISLSNQKGGAGKTTTTINLAAALALAGKKVLCMEADPQGNMSVGFGCDFPDEIEYTMAELMQDVMNEREPNWAECLLHHGDIDYIPANIGLEDVELKLVTAMARERILRNIIQNYRDKYDYILIDCRPSLGMLTMNALTTSDYVMIPYAADIYGAKGMEQLLSNIFKVKKYLNPSIQIMGILLTVCDGTNLTNDVQRMIQEAYGKHIHIFDVKIPKTVGVREAAKNGLTIFEYKKNQTLQKARTAYEQLGNEVMIYGK